MTPLHFTLFFSGTVQPNGGNENANDIAMTAGELVANLEQAVSDILGEGRVTGDTPATLDSNEHRVRVTRGGQADMMVVPVISIAHLDQDTVELLTTNPGCCTWAMVAGYAEGLFMRFYDEEGLQGEVPASAREIRSWLKAQGHEGWVRLDRDWEAVPTLTTYEW